MKVAQTILLTTLPSTSPMTSTTSTAIFVELWTFDLPWTFDKNFLVKFHWFNDVWNMFYLSNLAHQILLETWDQTLHRLDINFTFNCSRTTNIFLWWNLTVNCILKAWVCFVYTRPLSQVVSLKWPDHYYLEKSRTRNSKQSVYSWRSTYRNLMYYQCKSA